MLVRRIFILTALATLAAFVAVGTAGATGSSGGHAVPTQALSSATMSGEWFLNRGQLVDIPQNGGPVLCGLPAGQGCVNGLRPLNGGVDAVAVEIEQHQSTYGTIVVPEDAFMQGYPGMSSVNAST